jgi:hypothetical protein
MTQGQWLRLALFEGPNKVEFQMSDKIHKPSDSVCYYTIVRTFIFYFRKYKFVASNGITFIQNFIKIYPVGMN